MTKFPKVMDQSTPASIPAGQAAPPLSPELVDLVAPVVSGSPAPFPFKITPPPAPVPVVIPFSLTSDHPLKWVLTLINETQEQHLDLTNGIPENVTVTPSGAQSTPST